MLPAGTLGPCPGEADTAAGTAPLPVGGERGGPLSEDDVPPPQERGKTVHGEAANAGHRVLAPDDAEVEAYLETALNAPPLDRSRDDALAGTTDAARGTVVVLDFG